MKTKKKGPRMLPRLLLWSRKHRSGIALKEKRLKKRKRNIEITNIIEISFWKRPPKWKNLSVTSIFILPSSRPSDSACLARNRTETIINYSILASFSLQLETTQWYHHQRCSVSRVQDPIPFRYLTFDRFLWPRSWHSVLNDKYLPVINLLKNQQKNVRAPLQRFPSSQVRRQNSQIQ